MAQHGKASSWTPRFLVRTRPIPSSLRGIGLAHGERASRPVNPTLGAGPMMGWSGDMIGDRAENLKSNQVTDLCRHPIPGWLLAPSHRRDPRMQGVHVTTHGHVGVLCWESHVGSNERPPATVDRAAAHARAMGAWAGRGDANQSPPTWHPIRETGDKRESLTMAPDGRWT